MALTLDPATKIFTILQADLTLVSGSLYELDTDQFRKDAMDLLASETYIWMEDCYTHNTEVTVAGTTFARTIEWINGYSITFENNVYSVRLAGSNNNLFDVENGILNPSGNVTVISQNSGGLIVSAGGDAAAIANAVWDEAIEDHATQGNAGWSQMLTVYLGADGPGIYIDSNAANTNTVIGTDGTEANPVSTIAAAKTLATSVGTNIYYFEGNADITLDSTHTDWEFIGIGGITDNIINLGSQDVSRSLFRNVEIEGTQGGSGRITARDCALRDPGPGDTTLHIFAERCGLVDRLQVDTSNDNVFDQCYSLVAGTSAPIIEATGASGTISVRHYSGGIEFQNLSASHNVTYEGMGQVIFDSSCNVNANVSVRGIGKITDNTAGMNSVDSDAFLAETTTATSVWEYVTDGTFTAQELMRIIAAAAAGKASGLDVLSPVYRDVTDTKNRITATTDAFGNRTNVTLDAS